MIAPTLDTHLGDKQWLGDQDVENYGLMMQATAIRTAQTSANGHGVSDKAHTLDGTNSQAIAHTLRGDGFDASEDGTGRGTPLVTSYHENLSSSVTPSDVARAQRAGASHSYQFAQSGASVRRLTPTECERLQGFDDGWTDGQADGQRYRQLGNAVTVSVVTWIGLRIMEEVRSLQADLDDADLEELEAAGARWDRLVEEGE